MSQEERTGISNAIWLCANHARLIDRDGAAYTAEFLRAIKREHELLCADELRDAPAAGAGPGDLVAVGPDVVCVGELLGGGGTEWTLSLRHFVEGDIHALISFIESFPQLPESDRYVLVNAIGDGRALRAAPSWTKDEGGYVVRCPVRPSFPRTPADQLPTDLALSELHDPFVVDGGIATVSGMEALPQKLKTNLSARKGESFFHQGIGTRISEYYALVRGSRWFERLIKLEVIRQAAIPYRDDVLGQAYTPLRCVDRIFDVRTTADADAGGWVPIAVELGINGLGRWGCQVRVHMCSGPERPGGRSPEQPHL